MKKSFLQLTCLGLLIASPNSADAADNSPHDTAANQISLDSTERELKKISAKLNDLQLTLAALPRTVTTPGLGAQILDAQKAFERAQGAFIAKDWSVVISEAISFLNLTQKPDSGTWLKAQFMLARAYEERGQTLRATRAYTRYLATFTTKPNNNLTELTEVFERLVRIATKSSQANQAELTKFLSSIAAMEYPSSVAEELRYLSAVAGSNIGERKLAISWLSDVEARSNTPETKARSKYFRALIAIHSKDWQTAADQLDSVIHLDGISAKTRNNAQISLARVLIKLKKPNLALQSYEQVASDSESYRDASIEKIFLLIKLNQDGTARKLANDWLAKYSDHEDSLQLQILASWLDLRAGELDAAKSGIEKTSQNLSSLQETLKNNFQKNILTQDDAAKIAQITRGQVGPSSDLEEILAIFRQLAEMNQRLLEIDSLERSMIYALAKSDLHQYKPALANQINQYDKLTDEILKSGAELLFLDKERLKSKTSALDMQKLDASAKRREKLFGKPSQLSRRSLRWATWVGPAEQLVKLATEWERLNKLESEKNAVSTKIKTADRVNNQATETNDLSLKILSARREMLNTLNDIRKKQVQNLVDQSELTDTINIVEQFSRALDEEHQILNAYEPVPGKILDRLDDDDSRHAWNLWRDCAGTLYANLKTLKKKSADDLAEILASLSAADDKRIKLQKDIQHLREILEVYGGESLSGILAHYDYALSQRLGRQHKWAGDLEYLRYAKTTNEQDASEKKHALEIQILNDNVRDLEQGGSKQ